MTWPWLVCGIQQEPHSLSRGLFLLELEDCLSIVPRTQPVIPVLIGARPGAGWTPAWNN